MPEMMNLGVTPPTVAPGNEFTVTWINPQDEPTSTRIFTIMPFNPEFTAIPVTIPLISSLVILVPATATSGVVTFVIDQSGGPVPEITNNPFTMSINATGGESTTASSTAASQTSTSPSITSSTGSDVWTSSPSSSAINGITTGVTTSKINSTSTSIPSSTVVKFPPSVLSTTTSPILTQPYISPIPSCSNGNLSTSTNSTPTPIQDTAKETLSTGKLAGIATGALIFFLILLLLFLFLFCKKRIRTWKKRSDAPIVRITRTQTSSVDPISTAFTPFGQKVAGVINPEEKAMLEGGSRATTPSDSSESGDHTERYPHSGANLNPEGKRMIEERRWVTTPTASSESGSVPEYSVGLVIPPREKEEQTDQDVAVYGAFTSQQMEELHEQRKKMRDLIEVLKERRASVSSMAKSRIDDLEEGSLSPVRIR